MVLGDFHIHTNYSDGQLSCAEVIDLYGRQGFSALAITDHLCEQKTPLGHLARCLDRTLRQQNFKAYIEEIRHEGERARKLYGLTVIPGVEITKNSFSRDHSAHILALGIDEYIDPDQNVLQIIDDIHDQGGLAIAAHPVPTRKFEAQTLYLWDQREVLADHFDAWEVASGAKIFPEVLHSGLPLLANSDFHHPLHMNSWKTVVDSENHPKAILDGIRRQKVDFRRWSAPRHNTSTPRR